MYIVLENRDFDTDDFVPMLQYFEDLNQAIEVVINKAADILNQNFFNLEDGETLEDFQFVLRSASLSEYTNGTLILFKIYKLELAEPYTKLQLFRDLDPGEIAEFKQWARDNYTDGEISTIWHPVVQAECLLIKSALEKVRYQIYVGNAEAIGRNVLPYNEWLNL